MLCWFLLVSGHTPLRSSESCPRCRTNMGRLQWQPSDQGQTDQREFFHWKTILFQMIYKFSIQYQFDKSFLYNMKSKEVSYENMHKLPIANNRFELIFNAHFNPFRIITEQAHIMTRAKADRAGKHACTGSRPTVIVNSSSQASILNALREIGFQQIHWFDLILSLLITWPTSRVRMRHVHIIVWGSHLHLPMLPFCQLLWILAFSGCKCIFYEIIDMYMYEENCFTDHVSIPNRGSLAHTVPHLVTHMIREISLSIVNDSLTLDDNTRSRCRDFLGEGEFSDSRTRHSPQSPNCKTLTQKSVQHLYLFEFWLKQTENTTCNGTSRYDIRYCVNTTLFKYSLTCMKRV